MVFALIQALLESLEAAWYNVSRGFSGFCGIFHDFRDWVGYQQSLYPENRRFNHRFIDFFRDSGV